MHDSVTLFKCPVCDEPLFQQERHYLCANRHAFDMARQGYVNLLLPHHTGRGEPGDTREMLQSRRAFLDAGYYARFSDQINDLVVAELREGPFAVLDDGCGEGYYLWRLRQRLNAIMPEDRFALYGIDVSKPAIAYAAARDKGTRYAVGSAFHLPLLDHSIDCLLSIFSPRDEAEILRVVKPDGTLIIAAPGPRHLHGLKMVLYGEAEPISQRGTVGEGFTLLKETTINYDIHLTRSEDILHLVQMTPYIRHVSEEELARVAGLEELVTAVDFQLRVYGVGR